MDPVPDHGEQSYRGSGRLAGKKALITGGDSGIGRAVAIAFAREGAHVAISYLNEEEDAAEVSRLIEGAGQSGLLLAGDLADPPPRAIHPLLNSLFAIFTSPHSLRLSRIKR